MTAEELVRRFEAGDLFGLMRAVVALWLEKEYPKPRGVGLYVWVDDELPPTRITIPASSSVA